MPTECLSSQTRAFNKFLELGPDVLDVSESKYVADRLAAYRLLDLLAWRTGNRRQSSISRPQDLSAISALCEQFTKFVRQHIVCYDVCIPDLYIVIAICNAL